MLNVVILAGTVYAITEGVKNAVPKVSGWLTNLIAALVSVGATVMLAYSELDTTDTILGKHLAQLNLWALVLIGMFVGFGGSTVLDKIFGAVSNIGQNQPVMPAPAPQGTPPAPAPVVDTAPPVVAQPPEAP